MNNIEKKQSLNGIYRISLTRHAECFGIYVYKKRSPPAGNFTKKGYYRGLPHVITSNYTESIFEALVIYNKQRRIWSHCYS